MLYANCLEDLMCFSDILPAFLNFYLCDWCLAIICKLLKNSYTNVLLTRKILCMITSNVSSMLFTSYLDHLLYFLTNYFHDSILT